MAELPTGTLTLLFTDMEGSTRLLQQEGERYAVVLADCRRLLRSAFAQHHGHEVDTQGDAFFVVFARASDAVWAATDIQRALAEHPWQPNAASPAIPGRMVEPFVYAWACTLVNHNVLLKATWVWMCITLLAS